MRKSLIVLVVIIALVALWLWRGRDLTMLLDRLHVVEKNPHSINSITYNGEGTGGALEIGVLRLSLDDAKLPSGRPNVGTTKTGQLALSYSGHVFAFGKIPIETQQLRANRPPEDTATLSTSHSVLPWPNFFEVNWMTGNSPKWKRYIYQTVRWTKPNGAKLEMVWRYEQFSYANSGWTDALMTREGSTGLIRIEISEPSR